MSSDSSNSEMSIFEVQEIVGSKMVGNELHYKVRWKNYGPSADTYEPASNLKECGELLAAYEAKQKPKMKKSSANNPRGKNAKQSRGFHEKKKSSGVDAPKDDSGPADQGYNVDPVTADLVISSSAMSNAEPEKTSKTVKMTVTEVPKPTSVTSDKDDSVDLDKVLVGQRRKRSAMPLKELSTSEDETKTSHESDDDFKEPISKSARRKGPVRQRRVQLRASTSSKTIQDKPVRRQCKNRISYADMDSVSSLIEASSDEEFNLNFEKSKALKPTRLSSTPTSKPESKKTNVENVDKSSSSTEFLKCVPSSSAQLPQQPHEKGDAPLIVVETVAHEAPGKLRTENGTWEAVGRQLSLTLPADKNPKPPDTVITLESSPTQSETSSAHIIDADHLQKFSKRKASLELTEAIDSTDVCTAFGRYVGSSLNTINNMLEREVVMKKMQDLLYQAKVKDLKQKI